MSQRHLHELLQEDQEPFLLKNYIADRRCQMKKLCQRTQLQVKKRKPSSHQPPNFPQNFCKNACFFSFNNSPNPTKSPLFDFQSPAKSPCRTPNAIFLHIPARTAALLLEAALRIQKESSSPKTKPGNKDNGLGLFGSLLKRLTHRNKTRKREISGDGVKVSVRDIFRWDSSAGRKELFNKRNKEQEIKNGLNDKSASEISAAYEMSFSCSCNGRPSSAVWSEKSLDLDFDTSSSTWQSAEEELGGNIELFNKMMMMDHNTTSVDDFASYDEHFCESPFHFVLQKTPSSCHRTPEFSSPATSPIRHNAEGKEDNDDDVKSLKKFQEEDEEDKEQCSPVSVLDPPFEDDDDGHGDQSDDGFDLECSYAIVQRAKQQLLQKLRRFEKLAELDPVELEKRMLEQGQEVDDDDNNIDDLEGEEGCEDDELVSLDRENNVNRFVIDELSNSSIYRRRKIPRDMKRLVSDLINEEKKEQNCYADKEAMAKRVFKRFESWKEVESNTIDMMVEQDFKRELDNWKIHQEQVGETALEIELGIFGLLLEELSEELVGLTEIKCGQF